MWQRLNSFVDLSIRWQFLIQLKVNVSLHNCIFITLPMEKLLRKKSNLQGQKVSSVLKLSSGVIIFRKINLPSTFLTYWKQYFPQKRYRVSHETWQKQDDKGWVWTLILFVIFKSVVNLLCFGLPFLSCQNYDNKNFVQISFLLNKTKIAVIGRNSSHLW